MEVLNGRKSRFTVIRLDASVHDFPLRGARLPQASTAWLGRALLPYLLCFGLFGAAGAMLIQAEHWRNGVSPATAASLGKARHAVLQLLAPVWRP